MFIDIVFGLVIILALWKGYRRGLVVGLFSLLAIFIGLAAALKLSAVVADHLGKAINISQQWLPFLSFLLVFIVVIILVRLAAKALEASVNWAMLGWANKLGGIICYLLLYSIIFSVLLFYAEKMQWIRSSAIEGSVTYSYLKPWGPKAIDLFGELIPWFRNLFKELEAFFEKVSQHFPPS
jgi:membrane protein required for colicin V production